MFLVSCQMNANISKIIGQNIRFQAVYLELLIDFDFALSTSVQYQKAPFELVRACLDVQFVAAFAGFVDVLGHCQYYFQFVFASLVLVVQDDSAAVEFRALVNYSELDEDAAGIGPAQVQILLHCSERFAEKHALVFEVLAVF